MAEQNKDNKGAVLFTDAEAIFTELSDNDAVVLTGGRSRSKIRRRLRNRVRAGGSGVGGW